MSDPNENDEEKDFQPTPLPITHGQVTEGWAPHRRPRPIPPKSEERHDRVVTNMLLAFRAMTPALPSATWTRN